jgi:prepilin-type N-terminal cleavage/methylation domain-containing protein
MSVKLIKYVTNNRAAISGGKSQFRRRVMNKAITKSTKGFTLVEMMVVVAIIGILAAIGIPRMLGYIQEARTAEAITYLGKIATLIDGKESILGGFPGAGAAYDETTFAANNMGEMNVASSRNFTYAINADAVIANGFCVAARAVNAAWGQAANARCIYYSSLLPAAADASAFDPSGHFYKVSFTADAAVDAHLTDTNPLCVAACTKCPAAGVVAGKP